MAPALLCGLAGDAELGADLGPVVQQVLGHASASMTMDLYGHLVDGNLWRAARMVGGISGASEPPGSHDRETEERDADEDAW